MSKIKEAFANGKAFIGFLTGGDPSLEYSEELIYAMIDGGADIIEIGVPFSDPIAEGETIQRANIRALAAGTTPTKLFELVARVRRKTSVPIVFLTYLNPVYRFGYAAYFSKCAAIGVDGVIIPDLPFEESPEAKEFADENDVDLISLVAPTSAERVAEIAKSARGYLYVVSSMGVTGARREITTDVARIVSLARSVSKTPAAIGFGVGSPEQAEAMAKIADGVIVGSAIVQIIERYGFQSAPYVRDFIRKMKDAVNR
jgi:tryptophan synthase alpha chain